jgi:MarR family transcriptional regulator, organic hydroperoxide resistance regulator
LKAALDPGDTLLATATQTPQELAALNQDVRHLRNAICSQIGAWDAPA